MKLPDKIFGIETKEAYKKFLARAKEKPKEPEIVIPPNIGNKKDFIYVPSIKLHVARERSLEGLTWNNTHKELRRQGLRMLTIPEFSEFLKYSKAKYPDVYNEITEVRSPWRAEWLDAYFEKRKDGLYVLTHNKTKPEKLEDCLMRDKTPGIALDGWLDDHTKQGLPKKNCKKGSLYYWYPRADYVAGFGAGSVGASLDCNWFPQGSDSGLGVRAVSR